VAAEVAGLSLRDLVRAVYRLEQLLMDWQKRREAAAEGRGCGRATVQLVALRPQQTTIKMAIFFRRFCCCFLLLLFSILSLASKVPDCCVYMSQSTPR
jgi:hypothetical protein